MTAPKHTPGPWELTTVEPGAEWHVSAPDMRCRAGSWTSLAVVYGQEDEWEEDMREEGRANSRLVAAAPDLLAALQGFLDYHSGHAPDPEITARVVDAEKAIAKATGGEA